MAHHTTIEQSKHLLELGLPPETADMNWHELPNIGTFVRIFPYAQPNGATEGFLPCWSLGSLLELMPNGSHIEKINSIYSCYTVYNKPFKDSTPVGAAYNAICWLLEHYKYEGERNTI